MARGLGAEEVEALYEQCAPAIHRRALELLGRDADAWDVVQEVFEKMLRSGGGFRGEASPMTYAYRAATNASLNVLRARKVRVAASEQVASEAPAVEPARVEIASFVRALLARLSEREQEVAVLSFLDEMTQDEIALALGRSRKTVVRALASIRAVAAELGEVPAGTGRRDG
ncbi:MAG TPA: sigma-70 family RNA polymerase sigma factor [Myxococcaceae bacterium]|nr:sigma-70 family RNA polymerase sigma factor [Myxococcaceae bacterium]